MPPCRNEAPLGLLVETGVAWVSSLFWWVASQAVNKLETKIPCSCRHHFSHLAAESVPSRTNQQLRIKRTTEEIWPRGMKVGLEGL